MTRSRDIISMFDQYVIPTYNRQPILFEKGQGCRLWDVDGKEYLDFCGGIAVNILGQAHSAIVEALEKQSKALIHTSNLYYTENQALLAKMLVDLVGFEGKCFFCNSGGEANETLYKLARKYGTTRGGRFEVLTFHGSFHGRSLAGISATGQEKVKHGFNPMVQGFRQVEFNNLDAVRESIRPETAAILLESIQGEGGVQPADPKFLQGLRQLCDEMELLLMFDEVQTGVGRTGSFCGYELIKPGLQPDAISWAKGLAGGYPIGAVWARKPFADVLAPGSHASTFGGAPLASAVALAVLKTIQRDGLIQNAKKTGKYFLDKLHALSKHSNKLKEVRGFGLLIGVEFSVDCNTLIPKLADHGLLGAPAGSRVIRFLPPLNITYHEIDEAVNRLAGALNDL